jgi:hypothetical protein
MVPLAETFENKRLGKALAVAKVMQDLALPPKVNTNSQKLGYQKSEADRSTARTTCRKSLLNL